MGAGVDPDRLGQRALASTACARPPSTTPSVPLPRCPTSQSLPGIVLSAPQSCMLGTRRKTAEGRAGASRFAPSGQYTRKRRWTGQPSYGTARESKDRVALPLQRAERRTSRLSLACRYSDGPIILDQLSIQPI